MRGIDDYGYRLSGSESDTPNEAPESEVVDSNPYPLEGKYVDEEDRERSVGRSYLARVTNIQVAYQTFRDVRD